MAIPGSLKKAMQQLGVYHPLQSAYRRALQCCSHVYNRAAYRKYKGSGFICNACGASYSRFVPEWPGPRIAKVLQRHQVIAGYGENVYCPQCGSKNRERLLLAVFENIIDVKNKRILHFSPEAQLSKYLQQRAQVQSVDFMPGFYKSADPSVGFADATQLQFADATFDVVIANHVMEHIPDDSKAMQEILRILKPAGVAILQAPWSKQLAATLEEPGINDSRRQEILFGQHDHVRIYAFTDYISRLQQCGFRVQVLGEKELQPFRQFAIQEGEEVLLCFRPSTN